MKPGELSITGAQVVAASTDALRIEAEKVGGRFITSHPGIRSTSYRGSWYGDWWGVWHAEDKQFLLLEQGNDELCHQFCADQGFPDHLQIRGPVHVAFTEPREDQ